MSTAKIAELPSRAVLSITGEEAAGFLDRLVTNDVHAIHASQGVGYGALLTPQGKIISDFLLVAVSDGFLIDCPAVAAPELLKRFTLYKLRARVTVAEARGLSVVALWDLAEEPRRPGRLIADPRHSALGFRAYETSAHPEGADALQDVTFLSESAYQDHRIRLGIPAIGTDAGFGEAFPHDMAMDQLSGVAFAKGCYVGQEVVSRMAHRGTARRRPVALKALNADAFPASGTPILAGGHVAGTLGASTPAQMTAAGLPLPAAALAILRLDRVRAAMDAGLPLLCGDVEVAAALPAWASYGWPRPDAATDAATGEGS